MKRSSMVANIEDLLNNLGWIDETASNYQLARDILALVESAGMQPPTSYEPTTGQATHVIHIDGEPTGAVVVYKWEKE